MSNTALLAGWRQRWNKHLLRFLGRRVRASVDVEDLAQETYLRLLRARDLSEVRNPQAYLLQVARHVMLEWLGERVPVESILEIDEESLVGDCAPDLELEAHAAQQRLEQALEEVSPMVRAVLLLRLREDWPRQQIARQLGLTDRQVRRHLANGYDHLRLRLEG